LHSTEIINFIFAQIWLPWQLPWLPGKFINAVNPTIHAKNSTISYIELKFVQFWLIFV